NNMKNTLEEDRKMEVEKQQEKQQQMRNENTKAFENQKKINKNEDEQQKQKEEKSFIETIEKGHELYEKVDFVKDFIDGETNINKLIKNPQDLNLLEEMIKDHNFNNIDEKALSGFKELAKNVLSEISQNNTNLDFNVVLREAVKLSEKLFEKQLGKTKILENEM
uniref:hypothetical protein n=1 Tax=Aliarcobacter sp. TaxID=2321116 RepID=UPI0040479CB3